MDVGERELKARLSEHLDRVEHGEVFTIYRRGQPVAQIIPMPGGASLERGLAEGWITRATERPPEPAVLHSPVPGTSTTSELISRDRGA